VKFAVQKPTPRETKEKEKYREERRQKKKAGKKSTVAELKLFIRWIGSER
jgi:hypothetical protein